MQSPPDSLRKDQEGEWRNIKKHPDTTNEANLQDLETFISTAIANSQKDMETLKKELTERNGRKRVREEYSDGEPNRRHSLFIINYCMNV